MAALARPGHWLTLQPPDFDTNNQIENQGGEQKRKKKTVRGKKEKCLFVQRLIKLTELRAVPRDQGPCEWRFRALRLLRQDSQKGQLLAGECCQTLWWPDSSEKFLPWDPKADWLLLFTVRGRILW